MPRSLAHGLGLTATLIPYPTTELSLSLICFIKMLEFWAKYRKAGHGQGSVTLPVGPELSEEHGKSLLCCDCWSCYLL